MNKMEIETGKSGETGIKSEEGKASCEIKENDTGSSNKEDKNGSPAQEKESDKKSDDGVKKEEKEEPDVLRREFDVFLLNDSCKTTAQRAKIIGEWGFVLL